MCAPATAAGDDPQGLRTAGTATRHPWRDPAKDSDAHARARFGHALNLPGPEMLRELWERAWERAHGRPWCTDDGTLLVDGEPPGPHDVELDTILIRAKPGADKLLFAMRLGCPEAVPGRLTKGTSINIEGGVYIVANNPAPPKDKIRAASRWRPSTQVRRGTRVLGRHHGAHCCRACCRRCLSLVCC